MQPSMEKIPLALKDSQAFISGTALSYNQNTILMINFQKDCLID